MSAFKRDKKEEEDGNRVEKIPYFGVTTLY